MNIPRNLLLLYVSSFFMGFTFGYFKWVMPLLLMESEGALILGSVFSLSFLITAFTAFSGGILADRTGRRSIVVCGTFLFALGASFILGSLWVSWLLVLGVILVFMSPSFYRPAMNALITESTQEAYLGRAFSIIPVLTLVGMSLGSGVLGIITEDIGVSYALWVSLACAWTAVLLRMGICEPARKSESEPSPISITFGVIKENPSLILFALIVIGVGVTGWFGVYFPSFLSDVMSLGEKTIGFLFSVFLISEAVMQPVAGWFTDKFNEKWALAINLGGSGILVVLFVLFSQIHVLTALLFIVFSSSLSGFYNIGYSVYIAHATQEKTRGTVYGGMETLSSLSSVPAPVIGAFLWEKSPFLAFYLIGITSIGFLLFLVKVKVKKREIQEI